MPFQSTLSVLAIAAALQASPSTELRYDTGGRPVITARINGAGPYDMVLDTASQTSLLAPRLVAELRLAPLRGKVAINGAAGDEQMPVYPVDRITTGLFDAREIGMPGLANAAVTTAYGIIGIERFQDSRLVFDRTAATLSVTSSGTPATDYLALKGTVNDGLLTVPLLLDGVSIPALVDTGAGATVANMQALKALGWTENDSRLRPAGVLRGAGHAMIDAKGAIIGTVKLGPVTLGGVPIIFSDLTPGQAGPSIILGSDLLNLLIAYAIDFPRGELQIKIPPRQVPK